MHRDKKGSTTLLRFLLIIGVIFSLAYLIHIMRSYSANSGDNEMKSLRLVQERKSPGKDVTCQETFDGITTYYQHVLLLPLRTLWEVTQKDKQNYVVSAQIIGDKEWPVYHWQVDVKRNTIRALEEGSLCP